MLLSILPLNIHAQSGVNAEYFNDSELKTRVLVREESRPYLNGYKDSPAPGVKGEYFSARWTGFLTAPVSGEYTISVRADDGVRVWINDKMLISAWVEQEATSYEVSIVLEKDKAYKIKIEYYNSWLHSVLKLSWERPDEGYSIFGYTLFAPLTEIPASAFSLDTAKLVVQREMTPERMIAPQAPISQAKVSPTPVANKSARKPAREIKPVKDSLNTVKGPALEVNKLITLNSVRFVLSKAEFLEGSFEEMDEIAAYLKKYPSLRIKIIGHTDYEGNWTANYKLSQQRANAVAEYLGASGVGKERITVVAMGPSKPIVTDDNPENREANRRVEFILIDDTK